MKVVGLTGNIACGKSSLAKRLAEYGIPILDSDEVTQQLYQDPLVQKEIKTIFGTLDKKEIATMVFGDNAEAQQRRKQLEAIIHPRVEKRFREWLTENKSQELLINVLPLLFEAGLESRYDYIVTVICDEAKQIERLKKRNPELTAEQMQKRIKSQMPQQIKAAKSDFVLDNSGSLAELDNELTKLLEALRA